MAPPVPGILTFAPMGIMDIILTTPKGKAYFILDTPWNAVVPPPAKGYYYTDEDSVLWLLVDRDSGLGIAYPLVDHNVCTRKVLVEKIKRVTPTLLQVGSSYRVFNKDLLYFTVVSYSEEKNCFMIKHKQKIVPLFYLTKEELDSLRFTF